MKLSIITINYNNQNGLFKTIASVVNQTWQEFEYIIIDGGSTDGSVDIIKENADRIKYWISEPDNGIYHAMNKGVDVARGEYCIFMNSGDVFYSEDVLNSVVSFLDGTSIINGNTIYTDGEYKKAPDNITLRKFYEDTIVHQSTFIQTTLLRKFRYDESYKIVSDWKFWIQTLILDNCSYKKIDIIVSLFDTTGIGTTNSKLRSIEKDMVLKSLFPIRILEDYRESYDRIESRLYNDIKNSRYNKYVYALNVFLIKLLSKFKRGSLWIKRYPDFID